MKRRIVVFLVLCLLAVSSCAWADYWDERHEGTADDPYLIDSIADLVALRDRVNAGTEGGGKYYKLTENLNISQYTSWESIGNKEARAFTGHFDGNRKSIQVNIERSQSIASLFGTVSTSDGYAVKSLTVSGALKGRYTAGVVYTLNSGSIESCKFTGIMNCTYDGWATTSAGGIVAKMTNGTVKSCTVIGHIENNERRSNVGDYDHFGGVVGDMTGGSVEGCVVEGTTILTSKFATKNIFACAGGIVAYANIANFEAIKNCSFSGTIEGYQYVGGIAGYISGGLLQDNQVIAAENAASSVKATSYAGGIAGRIGEATVLENCVVSSYITISDATQAIGGIVGLMNTATLRNNQSYGEIKGSITNIGGVVGLLDAASYTISNNEYRIGEYGIGTNAQGVPSDEGCIKTSEKVTVTTGATLKDGAIKAAYSLTVKASGGVTPYKWTLTKGALPDGLKLTKSSGKISGTPTKAGTYSFTLKVTDNNKKTATRAFKLKVTKPAISGTLANGVYKAAYTGVLTASGGTAAYTWTISKGALPDGLKIAKSTGKITGTPTKTGTFEFTVKITDKNKATTTKAFTVKVTKTKMTGQLSVAAIQNYYYSSTLTVSNGTPAYKWTVSKNTLPEGLKLTYSGTSATVAGTPTKAGTYTFTLKVADKNKVAVSKSFTIYVLPASVISAASSTAKTESTGTSDSETTNGTSDTAKSHGSGTVSQPGYESGTGLQGDGNTIVRVSLNVASEDVVESYEGKDSDLVKVKANKALSFVLGDWGADVLDVAVYVDDRAVDGVAVKGNSFTLPAEKVHDDFKVAVKAKTKDGELESEELFVISE